MHPRHSLGIPGMERSNVAERTAVVEKALVADIDRGLLCAKEELRDILASLQVLEKACDSFLKCPNCGQYAKTPLSAQFCNHTFCPPCWTSYLRAQQDKARGMPFYRCPQIGCRDLMSEPPAEVPVLSSLADIAYTILKGGGGYRWCIDRAGSLDKFFSH
ncbi:unnamed protein product [Peniophora sp. CBMAI 1063]|nr:unnamed protein product [Peniophora sp. CBMAI 1063]